LPGASGHLNARSDDVELELYEDSIDRIQQTCRLVVAVHTDNSQGLFCYTRDDGKYKGFDIELIKLIAEDIRQKYGLPELRIQYKWKPWPQVIDSPVRHEVDLAIGSITTTPERAKYLLFSNPYWSTEIGFLQSRRSAASDSGITTLNDFGGMAIAVHEQTTAMAMATTLRDKLDADGSGLTVRLATSNHALFSMLDAGDVDGILYDYDRSVAELHRHSGWIARRIDCPGLSLTKENYGVCMARINTRLRDEVNLTLVNHGDQLAAWSAKVRVP